MNILRFDSQNAWLMGVTTYWRDRLRSNPSLTHCLASGNTPIPIYRELARAANEHIVSFKHARIYALDEFGGLSPDDPGRCRNMLWRDLVKPIDLPRENFHFLNPEAPDLDAECTQYEAAIGNGFDLVLLGIGLNGHLGMNEPGSLPNSPTRRVDLHPMTIQSSARYLQHDKLPRWGLTVGMKQFLASKEVWLIATGAAKAEVISRLIKDDISDKLPASLMRAHANCSLFVDPSAGALL